MRILLICVLVLTVDAVVVHNDIKPESTSTKHETTATISSGQAHTITEGAGTTVLNLAHGNMLSTGSFIPASFGMSSGMFGQGNIGFLLGNGGITYSSLGQNGQNVLGLGHQIVDMTGDSNEAGSSHGLVQFNTVARQAPVSVPLQLSVNKQVPVAVPTTYPLTLIRSVAVPQTVPLAVIRPYQITVNKEAHLPAQVAKPVVETTDEKEVTNINNDFTKGTGDSKASGSVEQQSTSDSSKYEATSQKESLHTVPGPLKTETDHISTISSHLGNQNGGHHFILNKVKEHSGVAKPSGFVSNLNNFNKGHHGFNFGHFPGPGQAAGFNPSFGKNLVSQGYGNFGFGMNKHFPKHTYNFISGNSGFRQGSNFHFGPGTFNLEHKPKFGLHGSHGHGHSFLGHTPVTSSHTFSGHIQNGGFSSGNKHTSNNSPNPSNSNVTPGTSYSAVSNTASFTHGAKPGISLGNTKTKHGIHFGENTGTSAFAHNTRNAIGLGHSGIGHDSTFGKGTFNTISGHGFNTAIESSSSNVKETPKDNSASTSTGLEQNLQFNIPGSEHLVGLSSSGIGQTSSTILGTFGSQALTSSTGHTLGSEVGPGVIQSGQESTYITQSVSSTNANVAQSPSVSSVKYELNNNNNIEKLNSEMKHDSSAGLSLSASTLGQTSNNLGSISVNSAPYTNVGITSGNFGHGELTNTNFAYINSSPQHISNVGLASENLGVTQISNSALGSNAGFKTGTREQNSNYAVKQESNALEHKPNNVLRTENLVSSNNHGFSVGSGSPNIGHLSNNALRTVNSGFGQTLNSAVTQGSFAAGPFTNNGITSVNSINGQSSNNAVQNSLIGQNILGSSSSNVGQVSNALPNSGRPASLTGQSVGNSVQSSSSGFGYFPNIGSGQSNSVSSFYSNSPVQSQSSPGHATNTATYSGLTNSQYNNANFQSSAFGHLSNINAGSISSGVGQGSSHSGNGYTTRFGTNSANSVHSLNPNNGLINLAATSLQGQTSNPGTGITTFGQPHHSDFGNVGHSVAGYTSNSNIRLFDSGRVHDRTTGSNSSASGHTNTVAGSAASATVLNPSESTSEVGTNFGTLLNSKNSATGTNVGSSVFGRHTSVGIDAGTSSFNSGFGTELNPNRGNIQTISGGYGYESQFPTGSTAFKRDVNKSLNKPKSTTDKRTNNSSSNSSTIEDTTVNDGNASTSTRITNSVKNNSLRDKPSHALVKNKFSKLDTALNSEIRSTTSKPDTHTSFIHKINSNFRESVHGTLPSTSAEGKKAGSGVSADKVKSSTLVESRKTGGAVSTQSKSSGSVSTLGKNSRSDAIKENSHIANFGLRATSTSNFYSENTKSTAIVV